MPRQPVSVSNTKKHLTAKEKSQREAKEEMLKHKGNSEIECPDWLDDVAKNEFNRLVHELKDLNILTSVDTVSLAICCDAYSKWKQATELVNKIGLIKIRENRHGERTLENNPAVKDALRYGEVYRKMSIECGLTPNARLRLTVKDNEVDTKQNDEFYSFLKAMSD